MQVVMDFTAQLKGENSFHGGKNEKTVFRRNGRPLRGFTKLAGFYKLLNTLEETPTWEKGGVESLPCKTKLFYAD